MKNLESIVKKCVKGQFLTITTATTSVEMDEKQLKKSPYLGRITKETTYKAVRFCDYEHLTSTIEKREQGIEAQKPTWWEWVEFPFIARHKSKGTLYVVVKPTSEIPTAKYFLDGIEVTKSDIADGLRKESGKESAVYMIKLNSVKYLAQGNILYCKE
jgi:hypothetical protein